MSGVQPFNAIQFTTSSGENCVATKNNGIVTIQGDKNGIRQMSYDEFMKTFIADQSKKTLERSPKADEFVASQKPDKNKQAINHMMLSNPLLNPMGYMQHLNPQNTKKTGLDNQFLPTIG